MARIVPLWRTAELSLHRFDHPVEHEDQPYDERAESFMASFVETGSFDLEIGEARWRVRAGDVMMSYPSMRFRASFEGRGFNDTCLSLTYLRADDEPFDAAQSWAKAGRAVLLASNRLAYLHWSLARAVERGEPMLAEYCAAEIFRAHDEAPAPLYRAGKFAWYAERVHAARERIEREFARDHTISALAREAGMSMFHFARVFAALVGRPPHRHLAETRLAAARAMLADGRSVTETCFACGYGDLSGFNRAFARRYGAPPSRFAA